MTTNFAGNNFGYNSECFIKNYEKKVCPRWAKTDRIFKLCNISILNSNGCLTFRGFANEPILSRIVFQNASVQYWAASPPDYMTSFSGSGQPFPNEEIAFENSPNVGKVPVNPDGSFEIKLRYPNSYFKNMGSVLVKPSVKLLFRDDNDNMVGKIVNVDLKEEIPFRSSAYLMKRDPMFYWGREQLPVRPQYKILQDSGYPCVNEEPPNFWGMKPPE